VDHVRLPKSVCTTLGRDEDAELTKVNQRRNLFLMKPVVEALLGNLIIVMDGCPIFAFRWTTRVCLDHLDMIAAAAM
jgi:hypothetical protein